MLYFFHLRDGADMLLDPEGVDLPDSEAIIHYALKAARSILGAEAEKGRLPLYMHLDVEDETGLIVHQLQFRDAIEIQSERAAL
jgi:hypothetical protein